LDERELRASIAGEITRSAVIGEPLTLCVVDVTGLADATGSTGDGASERVLALLGQVVAEAGQPYDFGGRVGSSELVILIPGAGRDGALATARHLRRVSRLALGAATDREVRAAFSVTEWDGREDAEQLLGRAKAGAEGDGAVYDRPS